MTNNSMQASKHLGNCASIDRSRHFSVKFGSPSSYRYPAGVPIRRMCRPLLDQISPPPSISLPRLSRFHSIKFLVAIFEIEIPHDHHKYNRQFHHHHILSDTIPWSVLKGSPCPTSRMPFVPRIDKPALRQEVIRSRPVLGRAMHFRRGQ